MMESFEAIIYSATEIFTIYTILMKMLKIE